MLYEVCLCIYIYSVNIVIINAETWVCLAQLTQLLSPTKTFRNLTHTKVLLTPNMNQRWCDVIFSDPSQTLLPGVHSRDDSHPCGWALPRGVIVGARPYFSTEELRAFALKLLEGGARAFFSV